MTIEQAQKIVIKATIEERAGTFKVTREYLDAMLVLAPSSKTKTLPTSRPKTLAELTALRKSMGWPTPNVVTRNGVQVLMMVK